MTPTQRDAVAYARLKLRLARYEYEYVHTGERPADLDDVRRERDLVATRICERGFPEPSVGEHVESILLALENEP